MKDRVKLRVSYHKPTRSFDDKTKFSRARQKEQELKEDDYMGRFSCGEVTFIDKEGKWVDLIGDPRVKALGKFYRREDLGDLVPFVLGYGRIKHEDVNWDTVRESTKML